MLMTADKVGGSKKHQKQADVILEWSPSVMVENSSLQIAFVVSKLAFLLPIYLPSLHSNVKMHCLPPWLESSETNPEAHIFFCLLKYNIFFAILRTKFRTMKQN